jgi:hypothetical protein
MCRKLIYLISFVVLLSIVSSVQALTITTAKGNGADTYLSNDGQEGNYDPNSVHGKEGALEVRNAAGIRLKIGYIRFDITDVNEDLTGARVGVNVSSSSRDRVWGIYALVDESLDNWDEAATSYSNAPGFLEADLGYYAIDAKLLQRVASISVSSAAGYYESTPSALMDSFVKSDTNKLLTFALVYETDSSDTNPDWWMTSKEGSLDLAPRLVVPPPSEAKPSDIEPSDTKPSDAKP